jgi:hypothetical protein
MTIEVSPETARLIADELRAGSANSVDELISRALLALRLSDRARLENARLVELVEAAVADESRGDVRDGDEARQRFRRWSNAQPR